MKTNAFTLFAAFSLACTLHLVHAQKTSPAIKQVGATTAANQLIIRGAEPDLVANTLLISGRNFGGETFSGTVTLFIPTLGEVPLNVKAYAAEAQELLVDLPPIIASFPGTYLLQVHVGNSRTQGDAFEVTIGAVGPIVLGNSESATPRAGTLRWTGSDFEGFNGKGWVSLTGKPPSPTNNTPPPTNNMVWIPPGTFTMGSPDSEEGRLASEGPQTQVTISQGFWIGRYEVTQGEYLEVVGSNPSWFNGNRTSGPNWAFPAGNYGTNLMRPVDTVDQPSARNYCSLLTAREQAAGQLPAGYVYRLPTEAEWEYACRAGTTTRFSYGDDPSYSELGNYAWYNANSGNQTHPVGQKLPNPWGLYDMHGNLVEWSLDWYAGSLPGGSVTDPIGPASGSQIVHHSGTWGTPGDYLRSAWRGASPPTGMTNPGHGFRVVLARPLP